MSTRIEINPNLRVDGDLTMADLDEDVFGDPPRPMQAVEVFESSSGLVGRGWVTSVDQQERVVTLCVDWANLKLPGDNRMAAASAPGLNQRLDLDLIAPTSAVNMPRGERTVA